MSTGVVVADWIKRLVVSESAAAPEPCGERIA
jgi:hypothetical protein